MLTSIKLRLYKPIAIYRIWKKNRIINKLYRNDRKIYLLNIPSHGNLGDHLLSVAEQKFFQDNCSEFRIIPVTSADLFYSIKHSLSSMKSNDILCVTGGGFLGSMYEEEGRILRIFRMFPQNKIIILPQTIFYENTRTGRAMLESAARIYKQHQKLYVIARDVNSYNLLNSKLMPGRHNHIALTPDLALYIRFDSQYPREGILWCLRQDSEKIDKNLPITKVLHDLLSSRKLKECYTDTYVDHSIPLESEHYEVERKMIQFSRAQLVITDRLHGMIYSVITGTPVLAMDNLSGKIGQVYNHWLSDIPFVRFVNSSHQCETALNDLLSMGGCHYENAGILNKYQPIKNFIYAEN